MLNHGFQENVGARRVIHEKALRPLHALPRLDVGGEVQNSIKPGVSHDSAEQGRIRDISQDEFRLGMNRFSMPLFKAIQHCDPVTGFYKHPDNMTANVSGSTRHK